MIECVSVVDFGMAKDGEWEKEERVLVSGLAVVDVVGGIAGKKG